MFYFSGTDVEVAGASPETLVKLENGILHTFPLAGTRRRGMNEDEDRELEKELLADEKELVAFLNSKGIKCHDEESAMEAVKKYSEDIEDEDKYISLYKYQIEE